VFSFESEISEDFGVFEDLSHGGALGDVDGEDEVPLEVVERFAALPVDLVEAEPAGLAVGVGGGILELHGALVTVREILETALGVGLVLPGTLAAPPVDGAELDHLREEGDDLLEHHDGFDRGGGVGGALPRQLGEGLAEDVLGILVSESLAEQKTEPEGAKNGVEAVPLGVRESAVPSAAEPVEVEVFLVALVGGVVVQLRVGLFGAVAGDVVAALVVGGFESFGRELRFAGMAGVAVEEAGEDPGGEFARRGVRNENALDRFTDAAIGRPPNLFEEGEVRLGGANHGSNPNKECPSKHCRAATTQGCGEEIEAGGGRIWKSLPLRSGWRRVKTMRAAMRTTVLMVISVRIIDPAPPLAAQTPLCGAHPGNPELVWGSATCAYHEVNGIGQTLISLDQASVIRWDHLALQAPQSGLVFNWAGPQGGDAMVVNRVTGGDPAAGFVHTVAGTIEFPGGDVVVVNPNSVLQVTGEVTAGAVILSTHDLSASQQSALLSGQAAEFTEAMLPMGVFDAEITATGGDVILGAQQVTVSSQLPGSGDDAAQVAAPSGAVRVFAGRSFRLETSGDERLTSLASGGSGGITLSRTLKAGEDVELHAVRGISNAGIIEADEGRGRVFLRVDDGNGRIDNDGLILGTPEANIAITNSGRIEPDEGDAPSAVSTGISRFPALQRPGQAATGRRVVVYESAPPVGSASAGRDRANESRRARLARTGILARGRSFFGVRGGSSARKEP